MPNLLTSRTMPAHYNALSAFVCQSRSDIMHESDWVTSLQLWSGPVKWPGIGMVTGSQDHCIVSRQQISMHVVEDCIQIVPLRTPQHHVRIICTVQNHSTCISFVASRATLQWMLFVHVIAFELRSGACVRAAPVCQFIVRADRMSSNTTLV